MDAGTGDLVQTAIVQDSAFEWGHPELDSTSYTWFVRAFNTNATSEKVSDWAGGDTITVLSQPCCSNRGDFDHNGVVDTLDLFALASYMNYDGAYPGCWDEADVDGDRDIDIADLIYLNSYLNSSGSDPADCPHY